MREQGIAFAVREWYAFFMPARAGAATAQRAAAALRPVLAQADVVEFASSSAWKRRPSTPQELAALLKTDASEWGGLVKQTGFTAES